MGLRNIKWNRVATTFLFAFAVIAAQFAGVSFAHAASNVDTWTGTAGDNKFSTAGNWSGNVAPVTGDVLSFNLGILSASATLDNDLTGLSLGGISFSGNASGAYNYTISGNPITLTGNITSTSTYTAQNYIMSNTIEANMILGADISSESTALGNTSTTIDTQGHTLTLVGASNCGLYIDAQLLGSGAFIINTATGSNGMVVLKGNSSSYTGQISVTQGNLRFDASSPGVLGDSSAGTVVSGEGALTILNNADQTLSEPFTFSGTGPITAFMGSALGLSGCGGGGGSSNSTLTLSGGVTLQSDYSYLGYNNVKLRITGTYNPNGHTFSVATGSTGTLETPQGTAEIPVVNTDLSGNSPQTIAMVGNKEVATLDGARGSVNVQTGGTLKGIGTANSLFVDNGGIVAPGHSPGKLTVLTTYSQSGTYQAELQNKDNYDQLVVGNAADTTGNDVTLYSGAILDTILYPGYSINKGDTFKIIDNLSQTPVSGTFAGLPEGTQFTVGNVTFNISYVGGDGNDVVLTALSTGADPGTPNTSAQLLKLANPTVLAGLGIVTAAILIFAAKRRHES